MKVMVRVLIFCLALVVCRHSTSIAGQFAGLENGDFTVELNDTSIFYSVRGQGPALMALPNSWGLTHQGLRALYRGLEAHLTMVYFDPRGMGKSAATVTNEDMSMAAVRMDLDALRRHLGLDRVNVIGWSNGGFNLLLHAALHSDTLASAIVLHSSANFSEDDMQDVREKYGELFYLFEAFQREMTEDSGVDEDEKNIRMKSFVINKWFPFLFADRDFGKRTLPAIYRDAGFSWRHSAYANTVDSQQDARDAVARISCPMLLIAGAHDMVSPAKVEETHEAIAGSRFLLFENSSHFAPLEEPEKFVNAVVEFVDTVSR